MRRHLKDYDEECFVCLSPLKDSIEDRYVRWYTQREMEDLFGTEEVPFDYPAMERHMKALKKNLERAANTYDAFSKITEVGMERIREDKRFVTPRMFLESLVHVDHREGRIVTQTKDLGPRTVVFIAPPMPGGTLGVMESEVIEGTVVPLGPPVPQIEGVKE